MTWLDEYITDLRRVQASPWFALYLEPWGIAGRAHGDAEYRLPEPGEPNLLYFPPPYHPIECVAAIRGWGGVRPADPSVSPVAAASVIGTAREKKTWADAVAAVGGYLFFSRGRSMMAAHLTTPVETRGCQDIRAYYASQEAGCRAFEALGFAERDWAGCRLRTGLSKEFCTDVPDFWPTVLADGGTV